ncbi:MAG: rhodanese-like domain-containing protein [Jatrophihabitantaceae bacterium]
MDERATYRGVAELLAAARAGLSRLSPEQAAEAVAAGALIVDIRPVWQRAAEGEIAGSIIVERNHLEWRLDPGSDARLDCAVPGQRWVVTCSQGYTSSLAAAALNSIGVPASDLAGGVQAWRAAGLPLVTGPSRIDQVVAPASLLDFGDLGGPDVEHEAAH